MCHMVHRAVACLGAQSGTRKRTNKSGTCTGNEHARRYARNLCSSRERGRVDRKGNFDPEAFEFVNCASEIPILRGPRRLDSLPVNRATAESLFEETFSLPYLLSYLRTPKFPAETPRMEFWSRSKFCLG